MLRQYQQEAIEAIPDSGKVYNLLTVIEEYFSKPKGNRWWKCICSCGQICLKTTSQLNDKSNPNKSCGCLRNKSIKKASQIAWTKTTKWKGDYKKQLKWLVKNIKSRCYNPKDKRYKNYGGRGIAVCEEWLNNTTNFYKWATQNNYKPGLSIERIDVNGNYCPENCTFIPFIEQSQNTTRTHYIEWNGIKKNISQWSKYLNVPYSTINHRSQRGWSIEKIMTQKSRIRK